MGDGHLRGLDGLRGLAVASVVAFHLWPDQVPGGFVGVSLFFSLSGYLIVGRLDDERERTGTIALRAFWGRRIRRLLPASSATLLAVAVVWQAAGWLTSDIGANLIASLLDVANWFQIAHHDVYGVDPDASPVVHFWSLAIEEQAYLVLPLLAVLCRRRLHLVAVLTALLAGSALATLRWAGDPTVVYYSTFTRVGEILLGALAAVVLARWRPRRTAWLAGFGVAGLLVVAWSVARTSLSTQGYYHGGLLAIAVASTAVVVAVARAPQLDRLLGWTPLEALGRISYGVYLFHWPVVVGLRQAGVTGWRVGAITIVVTLAAAVASAWLLEQPIRRRTLRVRVPLQLAGATAIAAVVVTTALLAPRASPAQELADAANELDARLVAARSVTPPALVVLPPVIASLPTTSTSLAPPSSTTAATAAPSLAMATTAVTAVPTTALAPLGPRREGPLHLGVFGDSQAVVLALGMIERDDQSFQIVAGAPKLGCALGRGGTHRASRSGLSVAVDDELCDWSADWPTAIGGQPIDVAVVYFGAWDVQDRTGDPLGSDWSHIGQPAFDEWLLAEMRAASQLLLEHGTRTVVWLTINADPDVQPLERYQRYNALLAQHDAEQGAEVQVVDLAAWIDGTGERDRLLPDHRHLTIEPGGGTALEVADRYLLEQLWLADSRGR